jgi:hypothetical protein
VDNIGGMARKTGSHLLIVQNLLMRIPTRKTTKGWSPLAVYLPVNTFPMVLT